MCCLGEATDDLIWLQAAGHAVLIDAAAAVGQAALTDVLPAVGRVDVAAAVNQQVLPLAHVTCWDVHRDEDKRVALVAREAPTLSPLTQLVCQQRLALDGVSALGHLPAAVAQIEPDFPGNTVIRVSNLQECAIPYRPLLLRKTRKYGQRGHI